MPEDIKKGPAGADGPEPDFLKLSSQLCFPLYACARKIVNLYTPVLKPLGITYTQYLVFLVLFEYKEISFGDMCRLLFLDSGTLSPVIKKLESAGYLKRVRNTDDERAIYVVLTPEGTRMKEKLRDVPPLIGSCVRLEPDEAETLYRTLYKILYADCEKL